MNNEIATPFTKMKNKCLSCVYLCWNSGNTLSEASELNERSRRQIINNQYGVANRYYLRCYKGLIAPKDMENDVEIATCPNKGWKLHIDGKTPQISFQQEQHNKTLKWTITGVVISSIILVSTMVLGILNLDSC